MQKVTDYPAYTRGIILIPEITEDGKVKSLTVSNGEKVFTGSHFQDIAVNRTIRMLEAVWRGESWSEGFFIIPSTAKLVEGAPYLYEFQVGQYTAYCTKNPSAIRYDKPNPTYAESNVDYGPNIITLDDGRSVFFNGFGKESDSIEVQVDAGSKFTHEDLKQIERALEANRSGLEMFKRSPPSIDEKVHQEINNQIKAILE